jgi:hypothetical protein
LTEPRWEDYNYTKHKTELNKHANRFDYLGNGSTHEEGMDENGNFGDTAWYITEPNPILTEMGQVAGSHVLNIMNSTSSSGNAIVPANRH